MGPLKNTEKKNPLLLMTFKNMFEEVVALLRRRREKPTIVIDI
jgi:hypothetical protein